MFPFPNPKDPEAPHDPSGWIERFSGSVRLCGWEEDEYDAYKQLENLMDPDAAFHRFCNTVCDGDQEDAVDALTDILEWVDGGGVPPQFPSAAVPAKFLMNLREFLKTSANKS